MQNNIPASKRIAAAEQALAMLAKLQLDRKHDMLLAQVLATQPRNRPAVPAHAVPRKPVAKQHIAGACLCAVASALEIHLALANAKQRKRDAR